MEYQSGFGNYFESEAVKGSLPEGQNNPQKAPHGLYAEQLTGSAFTAPRKANLRTWLYKIEPTVVQGSYEPMVHKTLKTGPFFIHDPNQMRWKAFPFPKGKVDFIDGLVTYAGNGSPTEGSGCAIHMYACTQSMTRYFYSADGDFLFVPQAGKILLKTECGNLEIEPTEMAVIPRGIRFQVVLLESKARGYICENYGASFVLPDLGPIGANGLANPRDFLAPVAAFEDKKGSFELVTKYMGKLFRADLKRSPLNTVAWHGNYYPYKYDLKLFNTVNTVSYDHPDPSIFTVLTSPTASPGTANIDFVIFPPRWMVAEHTFRPPYYHRNLMSEFMGLVEGVYDAKSDAFAPGGASLHNSMSPHGPDAQTFEKASKARLEPERYKDTLAFMFESRYPFGLTEWASKSQLLDRRYQDCWQGLKSQFKL